MGKFINAHTLKSMNLIKVVEKLKTGLREPMIVSDIMIDFPPISKEDNPEYLIYYVDEYFRNTGKPINLSTIP